MQGMDSLTPVEVRECADLRGAMSNIDASRNLVLHRAQVIGGSEETTQEIVKIMGQVGISAAPGVAKGISKVGIKEKTYQLIKPLCQDKMEFKLLVKLYPMDFKMHRDGQGANPREHR
ncbi:hypothetical protein BDD30_0783 [Photorhabdus asymbiotica]|nr:hypothetical protein BDD30_0783 [Photorhabdus asymbiotica]